MKIKRRHIEWAAMIAVLVVMNVIAYCFVVRHDMTDDHRYSLSPATKTLLTSLNEPVVATLYLNGELNSGFTRLKEATLDLLDEYKAQNRLVHTVIVGDGDEMPQGMEPILIHERKRDGSMVQTPVYPYLEVRYRGQATLINLLKNNRSLSGEENLNQSIEALEYQLSEALHLLSHEQTQRIAFLEGHHELPEPYVMDATMALSRYFQVDRGSLGNDATALDGYKAVIIADPQTPFSETDKYILDHYVQQGGSILWLVNGVQFSNEVLSKSGFTPVIPLELNLTDMWFRYGVRLVPALIQDEQCLQIPVDVSPDPTTPNYQPMPWFYAPLLLTSQASTVTRNTAEVSSSFVSPLEAVGGDDGLRKELLLATSSSSRLIGTPAEVNLTDLDPDRETFRYQFVPVGVSIEGIFPSVFAHRMAPEGVQSVESKVKSARQVFIGSGSIIRNEVHQGQALPVGYDRYSKMQFGNRDLIVNLVLWLTDDQGLIELRGKEVTLRRLNEQRARDKRQTIQIVSTLVPVSLLALIGLVIGLIRKRRFA